MEQGENNAEQTLLRNIEQKLLIEGHSVWGHGTASEVSAEAILEEGIVMSTSHGLLETAIPLSSSSESVPNNSRRIFNQACHWQHKDSKFIVMVVIPNGFRKEQVVETFVDKNGNSLNRLPSRFIRGYIDILNLKLVENPSFTEKAAPASVPEAAVPRLNASTGATPVAIPAVDENGGVDVW